MILCLTNGTSQQAHLQDKNYVQFDGCRIFIYLSHNITTSNFNLNVLVLNLFIFLKIIYHTKLMGICARWWNIYLYSPSLTQVLSIKEKRLQH